MKLKDFQGVTRINEITDEELKNEIVGLLLKGGFYHKTSTLEAAFAEFKKTFYLGQPEMLGESSVYCLLELADPVSEISDQNKPQDIPAKKTELGKMIVVPLVGSVYLGGKIIKGGHFTWGEATRDGTRIPTDTTVVVNIQQVAKALEEVREFLGGNPVSINSWYRDPVTNRMVGGATRSRHIAGDAVDFVVQGISPKEVNRKLSPWWGSRGGVASASSFTHLDCRGYAARWNYGF